jgi:hypothetical protein
VLPLAGALVVGLVAVGVAAVHSRTPGCSVAPPDLRLPEQLRTLGAFAQPIETGDLRGVTDAAATAATALHSDLTGAQPDRPVLLAADSPAVHDALVVPLAESTGTATRRVVGLVVFLEDCDGRAYFDDAADLLHLDPGILPAQFPSVSATQAQAALGASAVRLVWRRSPLQPLWLDAATGRSVAAGPPLQ